MRPGALVGGYRLEEKIGEGGFGEVWRARHATLTDLTAAIKFATDPDCARQLSTEGRIGVTLKHPGVVKVLDADFSATPPWILMELVEGRSLRELLSDKLRLPRNQAVSIMQQLLEALAFAHKRGVFHRDVKPENILLTRDGRVKLTDFGLGQATASAAESLVVAHSMMTQAGRSIAGTVAYMAPEQKSGEPVDHRVDLYAAGVVWFEMLAGRVPDRNDELPPGSDWAEQVYRSSVCQLGRRYRSAGEMLADLVGAAEAADLPTLPPAELAPEEPVLRAVPAGEPAGPRPRGGSGGSMTTLGCLLLLIGLAVAGYLAKERRSKIRRAARRTAYTRTRPRVQVPRVRTPQVKVPKVKVPRVNLPSVGRSWQRELDRARTLLQRGDFHGAIRAFDRLVARQPGHAAAYLGRARAYIGTRAWRAAETDLQRVLALEPTNAWAYNYRGYARHMQGDADGAIADYRQALRHDASIWQAWANLGQLLGERGRTLEARSALERAYRLAPASQRARLARDLRRYGGR